MAAVVITNQYETLLQSLRFQDAIDIAVVAFLIYRMIQMIRNTRAMLLVQGIVVIIIVNLVSSFFQLRTINWLLSNLLTVGVVVVAVIFQDELRRGLEELGRGVTYASGIADKRDKQQKEEVVKELVKAMEALAAQCIGALVVLERQTGLQEFIATGIQLDSIISSPLLQNIFVNKTPLHDGAVIIRDDRIEAAACLLPLSSNADISKELGTRHRAAIGLTEKSDALVIIVSEETGTISLAQEGRLTRYLNGAKLERMLYKLFDTPERKGLLPNWLSGGAKTDD